MCSIFASGNREASLPRTTSNLAAHPCGSAGTSSMLSASIIPTVVAWKGAPGPRGLGCSDEAKCDIHPDANTCDRWAMQLDRVCIGGVHPARKGPPNFRDREVMHTPLRPFGASSNARSRFLKRTVVRLRPSFAGRPIFIFGCPAPLPESRERPCFDKWPGAYTSVNCSAMLKPRTVTLTLNGGKYGSGVAADINGPIVLDDQFDCRALSGCRSRLQRLFPGRAAMLSP